MMEHTTCTTSWRAPRLLPRLHRHRERHRQGDDVAHGANQLAEERHPSPSFGSRTASAAR
jgi:hypothetical protein